MDCNSPGPAAAGSPLAEERAAIARMLEVAKACSPGPGAARLLQQLQEGTARLTGLRAEVAQAQTAFLQLKEEHLQAAEALRAERDELAALQLAFVREREAFEKAARQCDGEAEIAPSGQVFQVETTQGEDSCEPLAAPRTPSTAWAASPPSPSGADPAPRAPDPLDGHVKGEAMDALQALLHLVEEERTAVCAAREALLLEVDIEADYARLESLVDSLQQERRQLLEQLRLMAEADACRVEREDLEEAGGASDADRLEAIVAQLRAEKEELRETLARALEGHSLPGLGDGEAPEPLTILQTLASDATLGRTATEAAQRVAQLEAELQDARRAEADLRGLTLRAQVEMEGLKQTVRDLEAATADLRGQLVALQSEAPGPRVAAPACPEGTELALQRSEGELLEFAEDAAAAALQQVTTLEAQKAAFERSRAEAVEAWGEAQALQMSQADPLQRAEAELEKLRRGSGAPHPPPEPSEGNENDAVPLHTAAEGKDESETSAEVVIAALQAAIASLQAELAVVKRDKAVLEGALREATQQEELQRLQCSRREREVRLLLTALEEANRRFEELGHERVTGPHGLGASTEWRNGSARLSGSQRWSPINMTLSPVLQRHTSKKTEPGDQSPASDSGPPVPLRPRRRSSGQARRPSLPRPPDPGSPSPLPLTDPLASIALHVLQEQHVSLGYLLHLKLSFQAADLDRTGRLDVAKLGGWFLRVGGVDVPFSKLQSMIEQVDPCHSQSVDFWQFFAIQTYLHLDLQSEGCPVPQWLRFVTATPPAPAASSSSPSPWPPPVVSPIRPGDLARLRRSSGPRGVT